MIVWLFKWKAQRRARNIARGLGERWQWPLFYRQAVNELLQE